MVPMRFACAAVGNKNGLRGSVNMAPASDCGAQTGLLWSSVAADALASGALGTWAKPATAPVVANLSRYA